MMIITKLSMLSIINDTDIQINLICPTFWERVISSHVCIRCPNSKSGAYLLMFQQNEVKHNLKFVLQLQYLLFNEFGKLNSKFLNFSISSSFSIKKIKFSIHRFWNLVQTCVMNEG